MNGVKVVLKRIVHLISNEALVQYMKSPEHNHNDAHNDIMFEELRQRGFFLDDNNIELLKDDKSETN